MPCDIYCRVSTLEQATEGYSLQEQEHRLRSFAAAQGWEIHAMHIDPGRSGASLDRPGIQAVIDDCRAGRVDRVLTYKLDRLSRSQKDTLFLIEDVFQENGVAYVSMTESLDTGSPFGLAMIGILSVFAQLEREQIKERMMMGRVAAAKEGKWRGGSGVPIGYRYIPKTATEEGRLVIEPYEAEMVRQVFSLFLQGNTFHGIYDYMRDKYTTSYGRFGGGGAAIIPAMLANRAYIGDIRYSGQWYQGRHDPIIDQTTFDRAQARLAEYRAGLDNHRRQPYKSGHLLTGLLWCGECGARWCWHSCSYKAKDGSTRRYSTYTCYTKNAHSAQRRADRCSISVWPAAELEELVWSQVEALQFDEGLQGPDVPDTEAEAYRGRIEAIGRQLARLVDLYSIGTVPVETVRTKSEELQAERATLEAALEARTQGSGKLTTAEAAGMLSALSDVKNGPLEGQRELLTALISKITLYPERRVVIDWNF